MVILKSIVKPEIKEWSPNILEAAANIKITTHI